MLIEKHLPKRSTYLDKGISSQGFTGLHENKNNLKPNFLFFLFSFLLSLVINTLFHLYRENLSIKTKRSTRSIHYTQHEPKTRYTKPFFLKINSVKEEDLDNLSIPAYRKKKLVWIHSSGPSTRLVFFFILNRLSNHPLKVLKKRLFVSKKHEKKDSSFESNKYSKGTLLSISLLWTR